MAAAAEVPSSPVAATAATLRWSEAREDGDVRNWLRFQAGESGITATSARWIAASSRTTLLQTVHALSLWFRNRHEGVNEHVAALVLTVLRFCAPADVGAQGLSVALGSEFVASVPAIGIFWGFRLNRATPTESLVLRIVTANATFGADELNVLYGRHGFVHATLVYGDSGRPVDIAAAARGQEESGRLTIVMEGWRTPLYCYHYIVTLESAASAELALAEVFNPQVDFAALAAVRTSSDEDIVPLSQLPTIDAAFQSQQALTAGFAALGRIGAGPTDDDANREAEGDVWVPDLIIDNVPYHTTADQLAEYFRQYGTVTDVQIATSDRSGASLMCALVRMKSFAEAVRASDMNGREIGGRKVVCGVLDPQLQIVSITDSTVVLQQPRLMLAPESEGVLPVAGAVPLQPPPPPPPQPPGRGSHASPRRFFDQPSGGGGGGGSRRIGEKNRR